MVGMETRSWGTQLLPEVLSKCFRGRTKVKKNNQKAIIEVDNHPHLSRSSVFAQQCKHRHWLGIVRH